MRLIDADALKNVIHWLNDCSRLGILAAIDKLPTVDAVERKRGKWIDLGKDRVIRWQCSECEIKDMHIYNYCPNCGADMRGEDDETD